MKKKSGNEIYENPHFCPHCHTDLRSPDGPPYKREIGIEIPSIYDGVLYYECPSCRKAWERDDIDFSPKIKKIAKKIVGEQNEKS